VGIRACIDWSRPHEMLVAQLLFALPAVGAEIAALGDAVIESGDVLGEYRRRTIRGDRLS